MMIPGVKKCIFSLFICLEILGNRNSAISMETNQEETKKKIVNYFEKEENIQFSDKNLRFYCTTKYACKILFPPHLKTKNAAFNYVKSCSTRDPMSLSEYFEKTRGKKTMVVGSGLFQTMIQPILMKAFKHPFFVDEDKQLYPDMCMKFGTNFVCEPNVLGYKEQLDAIYFDNFSGLYSEDNIQAAACLLKPGGMLMMTYHPHSNGIDLPEEIASLKSSCREEFALSLGVSFQKIYDDEVQWTKESCEAFRNLVDKKFHDLLRDIWCTLLTDRLIIYGFSYVVKDNKKVFRSGDSPREHLFAIKI